MEAIILAGGLGTRLRSSIPDLPKPMAPIGGKPFLEFLLTYLGKYNIERVILSVGYKYEIIQENFGNRFADMMIDYAVEDEPLGTGGGIRRALNLVNGDTVLILNGDTFFAGDYAKLADIHYLSCADLTMALKPMNDCTWSSGRYGRVLTDGTRVIGFAEKKQGISGNINSGVYIMDTQLLTRFNLTDKFSFEHDFLEKYTDRLNFHAWTMNAYFIDIGVPEDYHRAQREFITLFNC